MAGVAMALGLSLATPADASPPGSSGNQSQSNRTVLKIKFTPVPSQDKYTKGTGLYKDTKKLIQLMLNVRFKIAVPTPGAPAQVVTAAIPQSGAEPILCTLDSKVNSKGKVTAKLLVEARRKKNEDGTETLELKEKKGSCAGGAVPAVAAGSSIEIRTGETVVLSGTAR